MKKVTLYAISIILFYAPCLKAQVIDFSIGGDLVSSYIWRGGYAAGASAQPAMAINIENLSLSAWGNMDIYGGEYKEVDFTVGYSVNGLQFAITDYWWEGERAYKYFNYRNKETAHHIEGTIGYTLPFEKFPLSMKWNTMFAGEDTDYSNNSRSFSTYISGVYPFSVKDINMDASIGITPYKGMYSAGFSVVDISLKATKSLKITDSFKLPVFGQLIINPDKEDVFLILGISI